jgi:hypothetical protein
LSTTYFHCAVITPYIKACSSRTADNLVYVEKLRGIYIVKISNIQSNFTFNFSSLNTLNTTNFHSRDNRIFLSAAPILVKNLMQRQ